MPTVESYMPGAGAADQLRVEMLRSGIPARFLSAGRTWLIAISTIITLTNSAVGQEILYDRPPDTTFLSRENHRFESILVRPTPPLLLTPTMGDLDFSKFLRQSLFQVDQPSRELDQNLWTLQWMWRDEVEGGNQYQALRNIVGAVEVGAVSYLAYRHLKRYGLK